MARCKGCGREFVPDHGNMRYHAPDCRPGRGKKGPMVRHAHPDRSTVRVWPYKRIYEALGALGGSASLLRLGAKSGCPREQALGVVYTAIKEGHMCWVPGTEKRTPLEREVMWCEGKDLNLRPPGRV